MSERETADGLICSRPDQAHRSHKNISRSKDKYSAGCGNNGRKFRGEAPPTLPTPTRHHPPTSRLTHHNRQVTKGRRRSGRGRARDTCEKYTEDWERGSEGERKGRKPSLNHLLNFTFSPREAPGGRQVATGEGVGTRRRKMKTYNKEQFLQANCQFVVSDRGDYRVHSADPDLLVDWDCIELVRLFCHEIPSCPICLYPPRAAKITRCGHVYCWSCVLHYLSLGDKKWRKCPICYESIYKNDLKSVRALSTPQHSPGHVITMRLMVRDKNSTLVRPAGSGGPTTAAQPLPPISGEGERFSKLLVCSVEQCLQLILRPEREALASQLASLTTEEFSEQCFIQQALEELKAREVALTQSQSVEEELDNMAPGVDGPSLPPHQLTVLSENSAGKDATSAFSDSEGEGAEVKEGGSASSSMSEDTLVTVTTDGEGSLEASMEQVHGSPDSDRAPPDTSHVYFYQSDDGQHLYLHTVNARCLVKEYGGLEFAPKVIKARIVEMEQLAMTEEAHSRYKYLGHLPLTCQFALCELDLRPPIVSPETLAFYKGDLDKRRNKRNRKRREERKKEKAGAARLPSPLSTEGFPLPTSSCQPLTPERIHDLLPQLTSSPSPPRSSHLNPTAPEFVSGHPSPSEESTVQDSVQDVLNDSTTVDNPSFADALRGKPPPVWPIKTSPRQHASSAVRAGSPDGERGEGGEEGGEKVPSFQEAFTEALLTAQVSTIQGVSSKKTAKKGRKKLVLFSTGGARGNN